MHQGSGLGALHFRSFVQKREIIFPRHRRLVAATKCGQAPDGAGKHEKQLVGDKPVLAQLGLDSDLAAIADAFDQAMVRARSGLQIRQSLQQVRFINPNARVGLGSIGDWQTVLGMGDTCFSHVETLVKGHFPPYVTAEDAETGETEVGADDGARADGVVLGAAAPCEAFRDVFRAGVPETGAPAANLRRQHLERENEVRQKQRGKTRAKVRAEKLNMRNIETWRSSDGPRKSSDLIYGH